MQPPIEITYQDLRPTSDAEQCVREHLRELEPYYDEIIKCHVTVAPHYHHRQGELYVVRVDLLLPDREIVVGRDRPAEHAHEDLSIALRDSFAAVRERLEERVRTPRSKGGRQARGSA